MRGAEILVQTLAKAGVRRIFSLSGNQIMPVYDACTDAGIEIVHTRQAQNAAFAPFVRPTPQSDPWRHDRGRIVS